MATLLVIDNYDSFTYNLVQMFLPYDLHIQVHRSDQISVRAAADLKPDYILISPGPRDPSHSGISKELIKAVYRKRPILGVCLGMQCINEVFGGKTTQAPVPMHGKTSPVHHSGQGLFRGLPSPFPAARYHSLMVELPRVQQADGLVVTARSDDGVVMGLSHSRFPLHGVQFHPESFLTARGPTLIKNFLDSGALGSTAGILKNVSTARSAFAQADGRHRKHANI